VYEHLILKPFPKGYTMWLLHRKRRGVNVTDETRVMPQEDNEINLMFDMVNDSFGYHQYSNDTVDDKEMGPESSHAGNDDIGDFVDLKQDGQESLYEGCDKYSKLSFLIKLYHIKCLCKISDKGMSMILELLGDVFEHAKIPRPFYEAKKIINKLGLHYTKILMLVRMIACCTLEKTQIGTFVRNVKCLDGRQKEKVQLVLQVIKEKRFLQRC